MNEALAALERLRHADASALDEAFQAHYAELKQLARSRLRRSGLQGQLQTTALVHDSYLKIAAGATRVFPDRLHFFAYASRTLRSIVIDAVREQRTQRRGGEVDVVTLDTGAVEGLAASVDVEQVDQALTDLARIDEGLARLVEMRFFGGLTEAEIADLLGTSERTVRREWVKARALLLNLLAR